MPGYASAIPDFTGRVIAHGRYQFIQKLGSGAYGAVYQALDYQARDGKSVRKAIKIICKDGLTHSEVHNLKRELHVHRAMSSHPNVVTYHHAFEDKHYVYIVLDFIPGGDLFTRICEGNAYFKNDDRIKQDFVQILDAVQACHRKRVFHRDLKPENILCGEDGSIYLADFGLVTTHRVSTTFGCGSGTYMSPECVGEECDNTPYSPEQNDIWSLGVILVNMITARSPWIHATTEDDAFHDYLVDEDFLLEMLPISKAANDVVKRIFQLEVLGRISLRDLRKAILDVDTFYMTEEEVSNAPRNVKVAWRDLKHPPKVPKGVRRVARLRRPKDTSPVVTPAVSPVSSPKHSASRIPVPAIPRDTDRTSEAGTSDSDDSEGPRTPPVLAVTKPTLEVPDLYEEQDLGDAALLDAFITKTAISPCPLRVINDSAAGNA